MRRIYSILLFVAFLASTVLPSNAKTTTSTSQGFTVTATSDVTNEGRKGIRFNITVNIPGPVQAGAWLMVTICDSSHKRVKVSGKGLLYYKDITLPYKTNSFKESAIFAPYSELKKGNISASSSFSYYVTVQSKKDNSTIKQSGYFDWKGNSSTKQDTPAPKPVNGKKKSWTEKYGEMTVKHSIGSDGTETIAVEIPCIFCHQSGLCQACNGLGQIWWPGLGCYQTCTMCYGEKVCSKCKGKKRHTTLIYRTPDGLYYDQNGHLIAPDDKTKGRHYDRKNCPVCDGSGVQDFPMYENDPSGAQVNVIAAHELGYQHTGGGVCRYCGKHTYHVHLKCYKCN